MIIKKLFRKYERWNFVHPVHHMNDSVGP